jgi:type II secretory pathway pseudopilin PulG
MNNRSRSTLFLIEQLIVIAVFAICAAACARILTAAYFNATESKALSNAIIAAENGAESFKAASGDIGRVAEILGGTYGIIDGVLTAIVYYDDNWQVSGHTDAHYFLRLVGSSPDAPPTLLMTGELSVEMLTGEEIIAFPVAALVYDAGGVQYE